MTIKIWNKFYLGFLRHYMDIFYELDLFIFKLTFKRLMAGKLTEEKGNERFICIWKNIAILYALFEISTLNMHQIIIYNNNFNDNDNSNALMILCAYS